MDGCFGIGRCNSDEFFLEACLKELRNYEIIYMFGKWATSKGAVQELVTAKNHGMTVWFETRDKPEPRTKISDIIADRESDMANQMEGKEC
jgi:2-succinyl-5-enolpyruvyl-6-hydroxy-3-cyclohexene-1-carboxylate synthase